MVNSIVLYTPRNSFPIKLLIVIHIKNNLDKQIIWIKKTLCSVRSFLNNSYFHFIHITLGKHCLFSFFNAENGYLGLQSYKNKTCKFDFTSLLLISFGNQYKKLERFKLLTKFECQKSCHKQDKSNIKSLWFLYFINIWYVNRICAIKKEHASFGCYKQCFVQKIK